MRAVLLVALLAATQAKLIDLEVLPFGDATAEDLGEASGETPAELVQGAVMTAIEEKRSSLLTIHTAANVVPIFPHNETADCPRSLYSTVNAVLKDVLGHMDAIHVPPEAMGAGSTLDLHAPQLTLPLMGPARPYITFSELLTKVAERAETPEEGMKAASRMTRAFFHMAGLRKGAKGVVADILSSCPGVLIYELLARFVVNTRMKQPFLDGLKTIDHGMVKVALSISSSVRGVASMLNQLRKGGLSLFRSAKMFFARRAAAKKAGEGEQTSDTEVETAMLGSDVLDNIELSEREYVPHFLTEERTLATQDPDAHFGFENTLSNTDFRSRKMDAGSYNGLREQANRLDKLAFPDTVRRFRVLRLDEEGFARLKESQRPEVCRRAAEFEPDLDYYLSMCAGVRLPDGSGFAVDLWQQHWATNEKLKKPYVAPADAKRQAGSAGERMGSRGEQRPPFLTKHAKGVDRPRLSEEELLENTALAALLNEYVLDEKWKVARRLRSLQITADKLKRGIGKKSELHFSLDENQLPVLARHLKELDGLVLKKPVPPRPHFTSYVPFNLTCQDVHTVHGGPLFLSWGFPRPSVTETGRRDLDLTSNAIYDLLHDLAITNHTFRTVSMFQAANFLDMQTVWREDFLKAVEEKDLVDVVFPFFFESFVRTSGGDPVAANHGHMVFRIDGPVVRGTVLLHAGTSDRGEHEGVVFHPWRMHHQSSWVGWNFAGESVVSEAAANMLSLAITYAGISNYYTDVKHHPSGGYGTAAVCYSPMIVLHGAMKHAIRSHFGRGVARVGSLDEASTMKLDDDDLYQLFFQPRVQVLANSLSANVFLDMQRIAAALSGSAAEAMCKELERAVLQTVHSQLRSGHLAVPDLREKTGGIGDADADAEKQLAVMVVAAMAPQPQGSSLLSLISPEASPMGDDVLGDDRDILSAKAMERLVLGGSPFNETILEMRTIFRPLSIARGHEWSDIVEHGFAHARHVMDLHSYPINVPTSTCQRLQAILDSWPWASLEAPLAVLERSRVRICSYLVRYCSDSLSCCTAAMCQAAVRSDRHIASMALSIPTLLPGALPELQPEPLPANEPLFRALNGARPTTAAVLEPRALGGKLWSGGGLFGDQQLFARDPKRGRLRPLRTIDQEEAGAMPSEVDRDAYASDDAAAVVPLLSQALPPSMTKESRIRHWQSQAVLENPWNASAAIDVLSAAVLAGVRCGRAVHPKLRDYGWQTLLRPETERCAMTPGMLRAPLKPPTRRDGPNGEKGPSMVTPHSSGAALRSLSTLSPFPFSWDVTPHEPWLRLLNAAFKGQQPPANWRRVLDFVPFPNEAALLAAYGETDLSRADSVLHPTRLLGGVTVNPREWIGRTFEELLDDHQYLWPMTTRATLFKAMWELRDDSPECRHKESSRVYYADTGPRNSRADDFVTFDGDGNQVHVAGRPRSPPTWSSMASRSASQLALEPGAGAAATMPLADGDKDGDDGVDVDAEEALSGDGERSATPVQDDGLSTMPSNEPPTNGPSAVPPELLTLLQLDATEGNALAQEHALMRSVLSRRSELVAAQRWGIRSLARSLFGGSPAGDAEGSGSAPPKLDLQDAIGSGLARDLKGPMLVDSQRIAELEQMLNGGSESRESEYLVAMTDKRATDLSLQRPLSKAVVQHLERLKRWGEKNSEIGAQYQYASSQLPGYLFCWTLTCARAFGSAVHRLRTWMDRTSKDFTDRHAELTVIMRLLVRARTPILAIQELFAETIGASGDEALSGVTRVNFRPLLREKDGADVNSAIAALHRGLCPAYETAPPSDFRTACEAFKAYPLSPVGIAASADWIWEQFEWMPRVRQGVVVSPRGAHRFPVLLRQPWDVTWFSSAADIAVVGRPQLVAPVKPSWFSVSAPSSPKAAPAADLGDPAAVPNVGTTSLALFDLLTRSMVPPQFRIPSSGGDEQRPPLVPAGSSAAAGGASHDHASGSFLVAQLTLTQLRLIGHRIEQLRAGRSGPAGQLGQAIHDASAKWLSLSASPLDDVSPLRHALQEAVERAGARATDWDQGFAHSVFLGLQRLRASATEPDSVKRWATALMETDGTPAFPEATASMGTLHWDVLQAGLVGISEDAAAAFLPAAPLWMHLPNTVSLESSSDGDDPVSSSRARVQKLMEASGEPQFCVFGQSADIMESIGVELPLSDLAKDVCPPSVHSILSESAAYSLASLRNASLDVASISFCAEETVHEDPAFDKCLDLVERRLLGVSGDDRSATRTWASIQGALQALLGAWAANAELILADETEPPMVAYYEGVALSIPSMPLTRGPVKGYFKLSAMQFVRHLLESHSVLWTEEAKQAATLRRKLLDAAKAASYRHSEVACQALVYFELHTAAMAMQLSNAVADLRKALKDAECGMFMQAADPATLPGWPLRELVESSEGTGRLTSIPRVDGPGLYCAARERYRDHVCTCFEMEFDECADIDHSADPEDAPWSSSVLEEMKKEGLEQARRK